MDFRHVTGGGDRSEEASNATSSTAPAEPHPTEFEFDLPHGYVDPHGVLHANGSMSPATARDELLPLMDERVRDNPAYLTVVLLARVITRLGTIDDEHITASVIESMFASDLAYLQELYRQINTEDASSNVVTCPVCGEQFTPDTAKR
ncbi:MAG: hypothetical protein ACLQPH_21115 [Acidimicrobiales bacterium]